MDLATTAGTPPGSGANFKALSARLASRGASNPDALAAYIGRKKYGRKGMAKLSAKGRSHSHAGSEAGISLAGGGLTCPECGYSGSARAFTSGRSTGGGASGTSVPAAPGELRTPAPSTGYVRAGVPSTSSRGASHALANPGGGGIRLAAGTRLRPVSGPLDVLVARAADGSAVLRHRLGGAQIGAIRKTPDGKWIASVNGRDGDPRDHQRTALMEAVGVWNKAVTGTAGAAPLQPQPQQTPLMAEYGIPATRSAAFATPTAGAADGPRVTVSAANGDDDSDDSGGSTDGNGLTPRGQAIYKKLKAKGFPDARALAFAKNAQKAKSGSFGRAG